MPQVSDNASSVSGGDQRVKIDSAFDDLVYHAFGDGGSYSGETWAGMRHGKGVYRWSNGQLYEGYFYYDLLHGPGRFTWPDGRLYIGYFHGNQREGYGRVIQLNGDVFEGLFHKGELFGPGVTTYVDSTLDKGLWYRTHLLQLAVCLYAFFNIPYLEEVRRFFPVKPPKCWHPDKDLHSSHQETGQGTPVSAHPAVRRFQLNAASVGQENAHFQRILDEQFEKLFSKNAVVSSEEHKHGKSGHSEVLRNVSQRLIDIQKHTRKMQALAHPMTFNPDSVLGDGKGSWKAGEKEAEVFEFFRAASEGDLRSVQDMIFTKGINVDVCDRDGFTPLMAATIHNRESVMNLLLDFGANIDHVTNNGLAAVEIGCAMYYCFIEKFNMWQGNDPSVESIFTPPKPGPPVAVASTIIKSPLNKLTPVLTPPQLSSPVSPGVKNTAAAQAGVKGNHASPDVGELRLDQAEQKGSFKSVQSLKKVPIPVPHTAFLRAADQLFALPHYFDESEMKTKPEPEVPLFLAWLKTWQSAMKRSLLILLRRGADWKKCHWPQPFLFTAVCGLDVDLVRCLVGLNVNVNERILREGKNVTPLLLACGMPGISSVEIVEALLAAGADPNAAEVDTQPESSKLTHAELKNKKKGVTAVLTEKGRRPIHIICQRDVGDAATEQLLELLVRYKARADINWNNSSPLSAAIQMGNVKMVRALLEAGCDVNEDMGGGQGNALCVLATLATPEGYLHTNKDVETIKELMKLLLESADFTVRILLPEGLQGSPLDFASHLYTKQPLSAALNPEFKAMLDDLRKNISEAYKAATQQSVLRRRKLMLAGFITPQLAAMLQKFPWLIDGADSSPTCRLTPTERELLQSISNIRDRIEELMVADIIHNGQKVRPTLKVPFRRPTTPLPLDLSDNTLQQQQWEGQAPDVDSEEKDVEEKDVKEDSDADEEVKEKEEGEDGSASSDESHPDRHTPTKEKGQKAGKKGGKKPTHNEEKTKEKGESKKTEAKSRKNKTRSLRVDDSGTAANDDLNQLTDEENGSETSVDTQDYETEDDKKLRKLKEREAKKSPKKKAHKHTKNKPPADEGAAETAGAAPSKKAHKKKLHQVDRGATPKGSGSRHKNTHNVKPRPIRQGRDRDGLVMENHSIHEKKDAHHDPDNEPSHGKLPPHDPFDPDHVTLIVPAVHMLDNDGDEVPLEHKTMEYRYCSNCAKSTGLGLFACPRCNSVFYDSKDCQITHWPIHEKKCREICRRKDHNENHRKEATERKAKRKADSRQQAGKGGAGYGGHRTRASGSPYSDGTDSRVGKGGNGGKQRDKGEKKKMGTNKDDMYQHGGKGRKGRGGSGRGRNDNQSPVVHRSRKPAAAKGGAESKHVRSIKVAEPKSQAEWMDGVRAVNVLRMDDEMQRFANSHYQHLLERGFNLAEARDIVELRNAEYYAAIAFHRHVTVTDLLEYKKEAKKPQELEDGVLMTVNSVTTEVTTTTKTATTFFAFQKVNDGNFSFR